MRRLHQKRLGHALGTLGDRFVFRRLGQGQANRRPADIHRPAVIAVADRPVEEHHARPAVGGAGGIHDLLWARRGEDVAHGRGVDEAAADVPGEGRLVAA